MAATVPQRSGVCKVSRLLSYLELLTQLEKLPRLFQNVVALGTTEFDALLSSE